MVTKENKKIISRFVSDLLLKYQPKYTLFSFVIGSEIDFVDKITPDTIEIFSILLKKFKAINLLSFNLLSITILTIPEFQNDCFSNTEERNSKKNPIFCYKIRKLIVKNMIKIR